MACVRQLPHAAPSAVLLLHQLLRQRPQQGLLSRPVASHKTVPNSLGLELVQDLEGWFPSWAAGPLERSTQDWKLHMPLLSKLYVKPGL